MRFLVAVTLLAALHALPASAASAWTPPAWADANTVELRTTDPGEEPYWFPIWHVVLDDQLYVRLGSRAAGRFDRNATKPIVGVRIAGQTFDRVRGVVVPEITPRVDAAMRDKYWMQGDILVRYIHHPYYMRLEPE